ncbi:LysR family transcriptional regulator [Bacillus sp. Marseille-P3661]|uniref:LysR family transcriptional regulator n=1 Tax=Bacillus sp. Marseille-P3661 TaxID=1936234 RepID=UPI000C83FF7C|nr:LysR family transcriptional regulator [Bacillus sp. Marseille-P3661]
MDIRQLRYFIAIAEEGTITKAADKLHMAQPPLSRQLKLMEEELGIMLFERNKKKKVTLTLQGELFLEKAKQILFSLEEGIKEVKQFGDQISGTLAIGSTVYCAPLMVTALTNFRKQYPDLRFNIWEGNSTRLAELLENRKIDIAISAGPFSKTNIEIQKLSEDPCVLVVPTNFHFEEDLIDVSVIATLPLILLRPSFGGGLYDQIINEFLRRNIEPNILCVCHDSAMLLNLVSTGFGATVIPSSIASFLWQKPSGQYKIYKIKENPWISEPALIWRSNGFLSAAAKEFIHLIETND